MVFTYTESYLILLPFLIEIVFGYPKALLDRIGHPIIWLGQTIDRFELKLNDPSGFSSFKGAIAVVAIVGVTTLIGALMEWLSEASWLATVISVVFASSLFATRSLWQHVNAVAISLTDDSNLASARSELSKIVSRDTEQLGESEISSSALESLSENTSDAVVAPLFWAVLLGLPGLFAYKAINTLDSMWGYRNERFEQFGKFAARLDDVANYIPARLTAFLILFAGKKLTSLPAISVEASSHASPNAGWPEAALAKVLNVRLGGDFNYGQAKHPHPIFNSMGDAPALRDINRGLRLYVRTASLSCLVLFLLALL